MRAHGHSPLLSHATTLAHGLLLRRANGLRRLPLHPHHMTPHQAAHVMTGNLLMFLSNLPPQDAHAPLCAVCHL